MYNAGRFNKSLVIGLLPVLLLAVSALRSPEWALALAGSPDNSGVRMYTNDVTIGGMVLVGDTHGGREVTRFDILELKEAHNLVIERDIAVSQLVPGASDWTLHIEGPVLFGAKSRIYSANACVDGVGLAALPLFDGLLDPVVNGAIKDGHDSNFIIELVNLVGPAGLLDINVDEMWIEALTIQLEKADLREMKLSVTPRTVASPFQGSCVS